MPALLSFWRNGLRILRERVAPSQFLPSGPCEVQGLPNRFNVMRPDFTKLEVDTDADDDQLTACLEKIRAAWMHLGNLKPHWSVLTHQEFLPENLGDSLDAFYALGEEEAVVVEKILARHDCSSLAEKVCVEYGSGVGRVTMGLARRFARVHGYDISSGHLSHAAEHAKEIGLANITFHLCSENLLTPLIECDVAYSRLVLQHNPPPVQSRLIRNLLRALKPGGTGIFQVLTYMKDYRFNTCEWLGKNHNLDMQMHCLPQQKIFDIIATENCIPLEVGEDDAAGHLDTRISNIFVARKLSSGSNLNGVAS